MDSDKLEMVLLNIRQEINNRYVDRLIELGLYPSVEPDVSDDTLLDLREKLEAIDQAMERLRTLRDIQTALRTLRDFTGREG